MHDRAYMAHQLQNILALTHPLYKSISCKYIKQSNVNNKLFLKQYIDNIVAKIKTVAILL
jgi:hypothetical protein